MNTITEEDITLNDIKEEMSGMLDYWKIQLDRYIENSIQNKIREIEGKAYDKKEVQSGNSNLKCTFFEGKVGKFGEGNLIRLVGK